MKIGIILNNFYDKNVGGGYSYYDKIINDLLNTNFEDSIEVVFIIMDKSQLPSRTNILSLNKSKSINYYLNVILSKIFKIVKLEKRFITNANKSLAKQHEKIFIINKIDILYYPNPSNNIYNYPYITTCWDLGHKNSYPFPEVSMNNTFEIRNEFCNNVYQKAFAIFCESLAGKEELVFYEKINPNRIFVLPMIPSGVVNIILNQEEQNRILEKYGLKKNKYFFYPAQFWSHKNHFNLINAFEIFLNNFPDFKLVLIGSDKGNMQYIIDLVNEKYMSKNIIFTGFVSDNYLYTFYMNSMALVYPSLIGPTNMPPLEARALGVKVICSNLPGHIEQLKNYPLYFDPTDFNDICMKMEQIIHKESLASESSSNTSNILSSHFSNIKKIRDTFGNNYDQY